MHEGNVVLIEKVMQYFLALIRCHTSVRSIGNLFQQRLKNRFIGLFLFDCGPLGGNRNPQRVLMTVMFCVDGLLLLVLLEKGAFKSNFVSRGEEQQRGEGRRVFGEVVVTSCAHKQAAMRLQSTELLVATGSRPIKIHWDVQNVSEL